MKDFFIKLVNVFSIGYLYAEVMYMTKDILLNEIIILRDKLTEIKFKLLEENNSDVTRHLSYTIEEVEYSLKEKMSLLENYQ